MNAVEDWTELLIPLISILSLFVVLPALILRHFERKRAHELMARSGVSTEVMDLADRLEKRVDALERILDVEAPGWREKHRDQP